MDLSERRGEVIEKVRELDDGDGVATIKLYEEIDDMNQGDVRSIVSTCVQLGRLFRDPKTNRVRAFEDYEFERKFE